MKSNSAYTLIELLIGITITTIVFTIGYAGYREFSRRQALTGISKQLLSDLRSIQQLALTGQKPSGVSCLKLTGYTFSRIDNSNYRLTANCNNNGSNVNYQTKQVTLSTGIVLAATSNTTQFKVLGQGTNLSSDNTLILTNTAVGNSVQISIGTGGNIK